MVSQEVAHRLIISVNSKIVVVTWLPLTAANSNLCPLTAIFRGQTVTTYERSAGIIPFRRLDEKIEFLLLHSQMVRNPDAAWEFPKGGIEDGEEENETAVREVREETCMVDVSLLPDFRDQVKYQYRRNGQNIEKTVVFFMGEVRDWDSIPEAAPSREHNHHPDEGIWFRWGSEKETSNKLFHPGMRSLLGRASFFLHEYDRLKRAAG